MWRLTVRYGFGTEVHDLAGVADLKAAVLRLRQDPRVHGCSWLRLPETPRRTACPACSRRYAYGDVTERVCRCGITHLTYQCLSCRLVAVDPPRHDGCGPVPYDAERWSAREWPPR